MSIENLVQNGQLQTVPTLFQGGYIANVYKGVIAGFPIPSGGFKGSVSQNVTCYKKRDRSW